MITHKQVLKIVVILTVLVLMPLILLDVSASIEDEAMNYIKNGTTGIFGSLTKDVNLDNENFLNVTGDESSNLQSSGKNLFYTFIDLFTNTKSFAHDAILFLSPYPVNGFLVTMIAIGFAVLFGLSILKKIGKHLLVLSLFGLGIVLLFVVLGWNN